MSAAAPKLSLLSCTHRTAPLAVREKLAVSAERLPAFYGQLKKIPGVREVVVVNTCNRIEIYTVSDADAPEGCVLGILAELHAPETASAGEYCRHLRDAAAVRHLFEVGAGIDSQIVGEPEILGQVKDAYAFAIARNATGGVLNRVFQKCFQAAAHARTHTGIGRGRTGIGGVATDLAERIFGELDNARVLVLGIGEAGRQTAQALRLRGAKNITVASRTLEKAQTLAGEIAGTAVELPAARETAGAHDIVIGSAAVSAPVLDLPALRAALKTRAGEPLFLIDLGMPRNFPPNAETLDGLYLYNLDDLSGIANENIRAREAEVEKAKSFLSARADALWQKICN